MKIGYVIAQLSSVMDATGLLKCKPIKKTRNLMLDDMAGLSQDRCILRLVQVIGCLAGGMAG
jgi:hypothetical protein